jgi:hypothetical protein
VHRWEFGTVIGGNGGYHLHWEIYDGLTDNHHREVDYPYEHKLIDPMPYWQAQSSLFWTMDSWYSFDLVYLLTSGLGDNDCYEEVLIPDKVFQISQIAVPQQSSPYYFSRPVPSAEDEYEVELYTKGKVNSIPDISYVTKTSGRVTAVDYVTAEKIVSVKKHDFKVIPCNLFIKHHRQQKQAQFTMLHTIGAARAIVNAQDHPTLTMNL